MKTLLSLFLLIQLALAPGGLALEVRYDCSMSGQRDMQSCCCSLSEEAFVGSRCCTGSSCEGREGKESVGEASFSASDCCRMHWEATPLTGDFDNSIAPRGFQVTAPIAVLAALVEPVQAPRPTVRKERYPAGVPPGLVAAVPLRLRHCSFLI